MKCETTVPHGTQREKCASVQRPVRSIIGILLAVESVIGNQWVFVESFLVEESSPLPLFFIDCSSLFPLNKAVIQVRRLKGGVRPVGFFFFLSFSLFLIFSMLFDLFDFF